MPRVVFALIAVALSVSERLDAQPIDAWQTLPNAPVASRHNDVYFVTPELGWIVNGAGQIYRTTDGGASWQKQFEQEITHFRSVGFVDSLHGWAGNVGIGEYGTTDGNVLYETTDGGSTWTPMATFSGPAPRGLCGMNVVNDSVVCAVGRVRGPAYFARTTDAGVTWTSKEMAAYAAGLIDVYFFHPDTGFAVGLTNVDHEMSSGVILFTADGGQTWETRFTSTRTGEWCWKITFPSRKVGYVSLQRNSRTPIYFLKTTDGGITWEEKLFSESYYFVQGVGFLTEQVGWNRGNSSFPTFGTTDGGDTWQSAGFGSRVNRFRFLGDTLGYAVGRQVYKYSVGAPVSVARTSRRPPTGFDLRQNFPNPFNPTTTIRFSVSEPAPVTLAVVDLTGRPVKTLVRRVVPQGVHSVSWDGNDNRGRPVVSGIYFARLRAGAFELTRKMLLLR